MATAQQRAIAILDAVLNSTSTVTQQNRAAAVFGSAANLVREVRNMVISRIYAIESAADKQTIDQNKQTEVASSFPESP